MQITHMTSNDISENVIYLRYYKTKSLQNVHVYLFVIISFIEGHKFISLWIFSATLYKWRFYLTLPHWNGRKSRVWGKREQRGKRNVFIGTHYTSQFLIMWVMFLRLFWTKKLCFVPLLIFCNVWDSEDFKQNVSPLIPKVQNIYYIRNTPSLIWLWKYYHYTF